jgi:tetratricopeptide (TPR) repeat protein
VFGREERPIAKQAAIVERAFTRTGLPVIQTVMRTAQDHCGGMSDHTSLLWLDHLIGRIEDPLELMAIANELPQQTVGLRERAAHLHNGIAVKLRPLAAQRPDVFRPDLAGSLNNLASFLSALGDREAALNAAREAADLYRALAAQRPDAFRPDLAGSLHNLASFLSDLGDREAALNAAREAADLYRAPPRSDPMPSAPIWRYRCLCSPIALRAKTSRAL